MTNMMIIALLLFILAAYRLRRINSRGDRKYDVFCISEDCMTVHTGLFSLTYKIEEIEEIRFSKIALRRGFRGFYRHNVVEEEEKLDKKSHVSLRLKLVL